MFFTELSKRQRLSFVHILRWALRSRGLRTGRGWPVTALQLLLHPLSALVGRLSAPLRLDEKKYERGEDRRQEGGAEKSRGEQRREGVGRLTALTRPRPGRRLHSAALSETALDTLVERERHGHSFASPFVARPVLLCCGSSSKDPIPSPSSLKK